MRQRGGHLHINRWIAGGVCMVASMALAAPVVPTDEASQLVRYLLAALGGFAGQLGALAFDPDPPPRAQWLPRALAAAVLAFIALPIIKTQIKIGWDFSLEVAAAGAVGWLGIEAVSLARKRFGVGGDNA